MAFRNPSNQLIQIDTGATRTYLYNKALSPIQVYADIGDAQSIERNLSSFSAHVVNLDRISREATADSLAQCPCDAVSRFDIPAA